MTEENGARLMTPEEMEAEIKVLRSWVIGLLTGCEDCTEAATTWVEQQGEIHTTEN